MKKGSLKEQIAKTEKEVGDLPKWIRDLAHFEGENYPPGNKDVVQEGIVEKKASAKSAKS